MKKIAMLLFLALLGLTIAGCVAKEGKTEVENQANLFPSFATVDINDRPVTDQIFTEHRLTLVNIWGTYCEACREELPALQQLDQQMKENDISVMGIIVDGEENNTAALRLLTEHGITYLNIIPNDSLKKNLFPRLPGVPTSIFVNNKGEIIGDLVVGARTGEQYAEMINKRLAGLTGDVK